MNLIKYFILQLIPIVLGVGELCFYVYVFVGIWKEELSFINVIIIAMLFLWTILRASAMCIKIVNMKKNPWWAEGSGGTEGRGD